MLLGVRISRGPGDRDIKRKIKAKTSTEEEYELSRYKPLLRTVIEENVSGRLDGTLFPYVKDAPLAAAAASPRAAPPPQATSLRSAKASWHKAPATRVGGGPADNRQRLLVFVAGGMTYSEMREAYQLSSALNKEIIIGTLYAYHIRDLCLISCCPVGSTHTIQPRQFVDDLKVLEIGGVGSKAIPNGLKDPREKRPFQDYYDDKYFLKDPPPRPVAPPLAPPGQNRSARTPLTSPSPSFTAPSMASTASLNSVGTGREEKKKKKGLFRF